MYITHFHCNINYYIFRGLIIRNYLFKIIDDINVLEKPLKNTEYILGEYELLRYSLIKDNFNNMTSLTSREQYLLY